MKTKLFFLITSIVLITDAFTQNLVVEAPVNNGATTGLRAPNGTAAQTTLRAHFIIPASELTGIPIGTVINDLGVNMSSGAVGSATGNLNFYLENTSDATNNKSVDWGVATAPMTNVYNGAFAIPTTAGPADFTLTNSFTYNGGGIYLAYEYIGATFATTGAVYLANNALPNSCITGGTGTAAPLDSLNDLSDFRPEIRFIFPNPFSNNLSVTGIQSNFGTVNAFTVNTTEIDVEITNLGTASATNVPVDLSIVSGTFSASQTIASLAPNDTQILTFTGVPVGSFGSQVVRVTVPSDQQTINDTLEYVQQISCDSIGYTNNGTTTGSVGFNTGQGILGVKYDISNLVPVNIKTIDFLVANNPPSVGNTIKGILLDDAGVMIDSTPLYTITTADLGQKVSLTLFDGNTNYANQTVFAGIRQTANAVTGYFPIGMQNQFDPPIDRNAAFLVNGSAPNYQNTLDPFMILITVEPRPFIAFSDIPTAVCSGSAVNIGLFPLVYDDYSIFDNSVLLQSNTTGNFTVNPNATTTYDLVVEKNACPGQTGSLTIQVVSEYNITENQIFCTGDPYNFNGTLLSTPGQYTDTLTANGGCDSIITLNLDELQPSSLSFNENICSDQTYMFAGQTLVSSGTYTDTLSNAVGCDSVITLNLVVENIDLSIASSGGVLTVGASGPNVTYQWLDCDNNDMPIPGETSQSLSALNLGLTGNYAVEVTQGNCSEVSPCLSIDFTEIENANDLDVRLYPNPANNVLFLELNIDGTVAYYLYDLQGKIVQKGVLNKKVTTSIDISNLETGAYVIRLSSDNGEKQSLFFKN